MTAMTFQPTPSGTPDSFNVGYLDGELAAEVAGLDPQRANAIADMADDHDPLYAQGYYEGYWSRHAVNILTLQQDAADQILTHYAIQAA